MAESILNFALQKLGDVIKEEAQLLSGVPEKVKKVQTELTNMKRYLRDAESKRRKGDEGGRIWLNMLRDVSYRIEDVVDIFHLEHENLSFLGKLINMRPKHKLANELDGILKYLDVIFEIRDRYDIKPMKGRGSRETDILPSRRAAHHEVDETKVVGLKADKRKILKLLHRKKTDSRAVITIVGPGGIGKTTLARMVYNNTLDDFISKKNKGTPDDFGIHIMIKVSQEFSLTDTLIEMINKLNSKPKNENERDLIDQLKGLLRCNRYLIILDDVWDDKVWNQLQHALPDERNGSRVLMTSRFKDVAKSANPGMEPYQVDFLSKEDSLCLLLRKALPEGVRYCPSDLLEPADALSKACKRLPLALEVVGGILSRKAQCPIAWGRVLRTMNWHEEGKECMDVLAMSYKDLPCDLKVCFMHLVSFSEDYTICANRLIRIWTAEGFIPEEGNKTMEERADDYLEELVQRCLIQVTSRSVNGSIKYFRVHDLLRDMAFQEAKETDC